VSTAFPDVKPFPTTAAGGIGHNQPPLEDRILIDFDEAYAAEPDLAARVKQLLEREPNIEAKCANAEQAGRYADGAKQVKTCIIMIEAIRETLNRPLLNAQRGLKAKADSITDQLKKVDTKLRGAIIAFNREEEARVARERAEAEEAARAAAAAAQEASDAFGLPPIVDIQPANVEPAKVRGDFGGLAVGQKRWCAEVEKVRQLPDAVLNHPDVIAAINKVLTAQVRQSKGAAIKGARVWQQDALSIR
jgi:hypothetical protein